jgi:hypothetical protein
MEYIGNYKDIIKDEWIDFLINNSGKLLPDEKMKAFECDDQFLNMSLSFSKPTNWYKFETDDLPFTIPWPVDITNNIDWWIIKQLPGQMLPMHIDRNPQDSTSRYVLMFADYEPGHVLIWDGELISNYKKGDLFKIKDVNASHGGANLSKQVRLLAYLTVWN